jgi:hypothetical protein
MSFQVAKFENLVSRKHLNFPHFAPTSFPGLFPFLSLERESPGNEVDFAQDLLILHVCKKLRILDFYYYK